MSRRKRLLLVFVLLALLACAVLLSQPYPRQLLFGPKLDGVPLCAWQDDFRSRHGESPAPDSPWLTWLRWFRKGSASVNVDKLSKENRQLFALSLLDDPDERVREGATQRLTTIGVEAALALPKIEALLRHAKPEVRAAAIGVLPYVCRDRKRSLQCVMGMLNDLSPLVRTAAAENLAYFWIGRRSGQVAIPALRALLQDEDAGCRLQAADTLTWLTKDTLDVIPVLRKELSNPDASLRGRAAGVLANLVEEGTGEAFAELAHCATADPDSSVRRAATRALGKCGRKALPVILFVLKHAEISNYPGIGHAAISAIVRIDAKETWPVLLQRGGRAEIDAVGEMKVKEAVPSLINLLSHKDKEARNQALEALGKIGPDAAEAFPKVFALLKDPDSRGDAIVTLGHIRAEPEKVTGPLESILIDQQQESHLRWRAAKGLGHLGRHGAPALPAMISLLKERSWFDLAEAVGNIGPEAGPAVPDLLAALQTLTAPPPPLQREFGDSFTIMYITEALGKIGHDAARVVPALVSLLKDESEYVRKAAAVALGRFGPHAKEAVPGLQSLLEDEDLEDVYDAAVEALRRIDPSQYGRQKGRS